MRMGMPDAGPTDLKVVLGQLQIAHEDVAAARDMLGAAETGAAETGAGEAGDAEQVQPEISTPCPKCHAHRDGKTA